MYLAALKKRTIRAAHPYYVIYIGCDIRTMSYIGSLLSSSMDFYLLTKTSLRQRASRCCILVTSEMFLTLFNNAKMADALDIAVLIFLHNI